MTMHSSKGLEFPVVYIMDANERVTPHHKAVLEADLEEERRMFYVAMTRAKDRLHVYYTKERYGKPQERSRFIDEYLYPDGAPPGEFRPGRSRMELREAITERRCGDGWKKRQMETVSPIMVDRTAGCRIGKVCFTFIAVTAREKPPQPWDWRSVQQAVA